MKQKFTLHIADLQLNVITEATPEEVDRISGILDRKMRAIYLKSRCPKTEAALLCALDAVAERLGQQDEVAELEERCEKYAVVLENIKTRNAEQEEELERLRAENETLRSLIAAGGAQKEEPIAPDPIPPTEFFTEVADAQKGASDEATSKEATSKEAASKEAVSKEPTPVVLPKEPEEAPAEAPKRRSRVGSMFDLLSFDEVD